MIEIPEKIEEESTLVGKAINLLDRVQDLIKEKITMIDSVLLFFEFLPLPAFVKDLNGRVIAVNSAYKSMYPVIARDGEFVIGFPQIVLNQYSVNDLWVQNYRISRVFDESAPLNGQPLRVSKFLKFPVLSNSGELVGVAGLELSILKENK